MVTDPVADFLTRIRNAQMARHRIVEIPASNVKKRITEILYEKGYILKYKFEDDNKQGLIKIALKYDAQSKEPAIKSLERISRPGLRQYAKTGTADTLQRLYCWFLALSIILQGYLDQTLLVVVLKFVLQNITFFIKDLGNALFNV